MPTRALNSTWKFPSLEAKHVLELQLSWAQAQAKGLSMVAYKYEYK